MDPAVEVAGKVAFRWAAAAQAGLLRGPEVGEVWESCLGRLRPGGGLQAAWVRGPTAALVGHLTRIGWSLPTPFSWTIQEGARID
eukprot:12333902-Alexandrium_andersonii.AAC.1